MNYYTNYLWKQNQRDINEDSLSLQHYLHNKKPLIMAVICDGVGGLPNGEYASRFVVSELRNLFNNIKCQPTISLRRIKHSLMRTLHFCHTSLDNCATTVAILVIYNRHSLIISCGDTRIYGGSQRLTPLTPDHRKSGKLLYAIGSGEFPSLFYKTMKVPASYTFLIASDGFYARNDNNIRSNKYFNIPSKDIPQKLQSLFSHSQQLGEKDNSSAIVITTLN